jgi:hypothetical protein
MKWGIHSRNAENSLRIGKALTAALALFAVTGNAVAAVHYVSPVSPTPVAPYTNWMRAARNIQDAVDAAGPGDTILVTNGVYATGGRAAVGSSLTNRVTINKRLVVQSVNGPFVTVIQGNQPIGSNAVRCVYLTNNATLIGFTLANGGTHNTGSSFEQNGGGAWCEPSNAVISRCIITNNTANIEGGGTFNGTLNNCLLLGNSAWVGGAAAAEDRIATILNNCTIVGNSASTRGGGLYSSGIAGASYLFARNCIVTDNSAPTGPNYAFGSSLELTMDYCCTTPLPPGGAANFTNPPSFVDAAAGNFHLESNSPCINAANNAYQTNSVDLDGNPRVVGGFVDIGAYEYQGAAPVPLSLSAQASYSNVSTGTLVTFTGQIVGNADSTRWDFKDGTVISNRLPTVTHSWNAPGAYDVALWGYNVSYPNGVSASVTIHVLDHPVHYVAQAGTNPIPPYLTWDTAATNIQDAVDVAYINGTVVVSNGTYSSGGRPIVYSGLSLSNRVAVLKPITLRSVNGPSVTIIQGYQVPGTTNGDSAIRCTYLTNNASLVGFTLTGGATLPYSGWEPDIDRVQSGGGVYCETNASVSNCLITRNCAYNGGGVNGGRLLNCTLVGNCAYAGGGANSATLNICVVSGNSASYGGGIASSTATNCLLTGNTAAQIGGGAYYGNLNNCTVVDNLALVSGGGAYCPIATLRNSIIYYNSAPEWTNYAGGILQYCCTTPLPQVCECVLWNFTNAPAFIDEASGNFRLQTNSPCINSGNNDYQTNSVDLDGNPRVVGGFVDIGAYEYQAAAPGHAHSKRSGFLHGRRNGRRRYVHAWHGGPRRFNPLGLR